MKKLLTAILLLTCLMGTAMAEGVPYNCGDYWYTLLEDGTARIIAYNGEEKELVIPAELDGHAVTAIGYAFSDNELTGVVIPDSVTYVRPDAFSRYITPAELGEGYYYDLYVSLVVNMYVSSLTSIHLGAGVTEWGYRDLSDVFNDADYPDLARITVSAENPVYTVENGLLIDKTTATLVCRPAAMTGDVVVPDWVTGFQKNIFRSVEGVIHLPEGLPLTFTSSGWAPSRKPETFIYPDAITDERMQLFLAKASAKTTRTITDAYQRKGVNPETGKSYFKKSDDVAALEATYPALAEGKVVWILRMPKAEQRSSIATKLEGALAELGYTEEDLLLDYQLVYGKEMECLFDWWEAKLPGPITVECSELKNAGVKGKQLANLRGGLAIAWAVQNDCVPVDLLRSGDFVYTLNADGTACIAAYIGEADTVEIPEALDGRPVTGIGDEAFFFRPAVTAITLPDSVTEPGARAFLCCPGLTELHVSATHPTLYTVDGVLFERATETLLCYPEGRTAEEYTVPQGVRRIAPYAFADQGVLNTYYSSDNTNEDGLKRLMIPDGVTEIAPRAFCGNSSLTAVQLGAGVTAIGDYVFYGCTALQEVQSTGSIRSIGDYAFALCKALHTPDVLAGVTSIGDYAFYRCEGLTSLVIPAGVTSIGDYAFYSCEGLTSFVIPAGVTSIGDYAFYSCEGLTSFVIPAGVTSVGDYAFYSCEGLTSLVIPAGVTSIGDRAFSSCSGLTSITLPEGLTTIGEEPFSQCWALTSITIPASVTSMEAPIDFARVPEVNVVSGSYAQQALAEWWSWSVNYVSSPPEGRTYGDFVYRVQEDGTAIILWCRQDCVTAEVPASIDGVPVTAIGAYAFGCCRSLTSITLPEGIASIGEAAFHSCSALTSIAIPEGVTSIGEAAFSGCANLTSIILPEGVTFIGEAAFSGCANLTSIVLPEGLTTIEAGVFAGCEGLTEVTLPEGVTSIGNETFAGCANLTSITLPEGVTSIGEWAFSYCENLTSITLPEGVTSIGEAAFSGCPADLLLTVGRGTPARQYAIDNGIAFTYPDVLDWLTN